MLHPSYTDLVSVINSEVEKGEAPVVNSRYSVVLATAKRTNQLIDGAEPMVDSTSPKPLSVAINEMYQSKIKILTEDECKVEEVRMQKELKLREEALAKEMEDAARLAEEENEEEDDEDLLDTLEGASDEEEEKDVLEDASDEGEADVWEE